jgi:very-short-patch-repair endonuclease
VFLRSNSKIIFALGLGSLNNKGEAHMARAKDSDISNQDSNSRAVPLPYHRARDLRRNQTDAETKLWYQLRAKRLEAYRFRRQFPIGNFIVDFCCKEHRLVIELDGSQHSEAEALARDKRRTLALEAKGYRVMRFWNNDVLQNVAGVIDAILEALRESSL